MNRGLPFRSLPALAALLLVLVAGPLSAEHEADHRYVVEGYVLDAAEQPRSGVNVSVSGSDGFLGSADTNAQGFYRVRLHLHNQDLGRRLTVRAGGHRAEIRVEFDPSDRTTPRVHELSFIGSRAVEEDLGFRGVPVWVYVLAAVLLAASAAAYAGSRIKKQRRRQARAAEKEAQKHFRKKKRKKGRR